MSKVIKKDGRELRPLVNVMVSNEANNGRSTWDDFRKVTPNAKSGYI